MATSEPVKSTASLSDRVRSLRLPPEPESGTFERKGLWATMAVGVVLLASYWWYSRPDDSAEPAARPLASATAEPADEPAERSATSKSELPKDVVLTSAETSPSAAPAPLAESGEVALQATGYIVPAHQILVSPKVSGMIIELNVEEGLRVKQGDVLAKLEGVEYTSEVARAKAQLASARQRLLELQNGSRREEIQAAEAELAEATAQRDQLYMELKRTRSLRNNKTLTESDLEKADGAYKAMDRRAHRLQNNLKLLEIGPRPERIEVAKAEVAEAEAALTKVEWMLSNTTVVAPISGTILKKNAEIGNVVNPVAFNGSFSLCEMADLSDLEVDLSIQERNDLSRVRPGQKCLVRAEAFPDRVYEGTVSRLMPIADRAKGAVPVRVKLNVPADEEGVYLKPEMSAVVSFLK